MGGAGGHLRLAYPVLREQRGAGSGGGAAGSASGQPPDPPFPEKTASGAGGSTRRGAERGRGRRHDLSGKPHAAARSAYPLPGNDPESAERRALHPECHDMGVPERAAAHVPALGKRILRAYPNLRGAGEALRLFRSGRRPLRMRCRGAHDGTAGYLPHSGESDPQSRQSGGQRQLFSGAARRRPDGDVPDSGIRPRRQYAADPLETQRKI